MAFNPSETSKKVNYLKNVTSQTHEAALCPFLVPLSEALST